MNCSGVAAALAAVWLTSLVPCAAARDQDYVELNDPAGDAVLRRCDAGAVGVVNPPVVQGRPGALPDLLQIRYGAWELTPSQMVPPDAYNGHWSDGLYEDLFRVDLKFAGLVNPPGPLGLNGDAFDPYLFGNRPVYGWIDFDMDADRDTGGELGAAALSHYLAVVGRFGQIPSGGMADRTATAGGELDQNFGTAPQYERSGAEFSLVMCGCFTPTVVNTYGDADGVFGPGNTWIVSGRFFQRCAGYRALSAVSGGSQPGLYDPVVQLRFRHSTQSDTTTVSLVYALTMRGAAMLREGVNCVPQQLDLTVNNDSSIQEAITDVIDGAKDPDLILNSFTTWILASRWATKSPLDAMDPFRWTVRAVVGTSYSQAYEGAAVVWTDAGFNERLADFNADGAVTQADRGVLMQEVSSFDGTGADCDEVHNGVYTICNFGPDFCVMDLNYDGRVDQLDAALVPAGGVQADINGDCRVNTQDLTLLLLHFGQTGGATYGDGDINFDGQVTTADLTILLLYFGAVCP